MNCQFIITNKGCKRKKSVIDLEEINGSNKRTKTTNGDDYDDFDNPIGANSQYIENKQIHHHNRKKIIIHDCYSRRNLIKFDDDDNYNGKYMDDIVESQSDQINSISHKDDDDECGINFDNQDTTNNNDHHGKSIIELDNDEINLTKDNKKTNKKTNEDVCNEPIINCVSVPFVDKVNIRWCDYCVNEHFYFKTNDDKETARTCNCACVRLEHKVMNSRFISKDKILSNGYLILPYTSYYNSIVMNPKTESFELAKVTNEWVELKDNGEKIGIRSTGEMNVYYNTRTHSVIPGAMTYGKRLDKVYDKICEIEL